MSKQPPDWRASLTGAQNLNGGGRTPGRGPDEPGNLPGWAWLLILVIAGILAFLIISQIQNVQVPPGQQERQQERPENPERLPSTTPTALGAEPGTGDDWIILPVRAGARWDPAQASDLELVPGQAIRWLPGQQRADWCQVAVRDSPDAEPWVQCALVGVDAPALVPTPVPQAVQAPAPAPVLVPAGPTATPDPCALPPAQWPSAREGGVIVHDCRGLTYALESAAQYATATAEARVDAAQTATAAAYPVEPTGLPQGRRR